MIAWRQDISALLLVLAASMTLGGWLPAFTDLGAKLVFAS
jgi:hypothetical protein